MANTTEGGTGVGPGENKIFFSLEIKHPLF